MTKRYPIFGLANVLAQGAYFALLLLKPNFIPNEFITRFIAHILLPTNIGLARKFEGWNMGIISNALCTLWMNLTLLITPNQALHSVFHCLSFATWILHLLSFCYFFSFKLIPPSGQFRVGYKSLTHKGFTFCVFYPTSNPTSVRANFIGSDQAMDNLYESTTNTVNLPRAFFNLTFHFLRKIKIYASVGAPIISPDKLPFDTTNKKFVPVIFSHGLGTHRNAYSSFCCELASHGHVVFSIDHVEEVKKTLRDVPGGETRRKYLAKRVNEVRTLLDSLQQGELLTELFDTQVPLAFEKLIVMGHSYGGSTSLQIACEDKRVHDCVLLDPSMVAFKKEEELTRKLHCDMIMFESETWNTEEPRYEIRERNNLLFNSQNGSKKRAIYTIFKRSDHVTFTDLTLLLAPGMKLFTKKLAILGEVRDNMAYLVNLVSKYVELSIAKDNTEKTNQKCKELIKSLEKDTRLTNLRVLD